MHNLTNRPPGLDDASLRSGDDVKPSRSPDGQLIALESYRDRGRANPDIWLMRADGSGVRRLASTPESPEWFPSWSPDGSTIPYMSGRNGNWDTYLVGRHGTDRPFLRTPKSEYLPGWASNSRVVEPWQHPAPEQVLLLLSVPERQACQVIGRVPLGEVRQGRWCAVPRVANRRGVGDQLLELTGLVACLFFGRELRESAFARNRIGGDDPVAELAAARCIDASAVLELCERLLAVPTGHGWLPPRGTQRDALLRMAAVGNFVIQGFPNVPSLAGHNLGQRRSELERTSGAGRAPSGAAGHEDGERDPQAGGRLLCEGERSPKMTFTFIARACADLPVATCCRVVRVSTSGFYAWLAQPCSDSDLADAYLTNTIVDIHRMSRRSYGSPRVHASFVSAKTCAAPVSGSNA